ncbi:hypothetical protein GCM10011506_36900 [Marivirga lumbricoides]|uniref:DUF805 domain-containing protein n=1 Tax=Marivirga lumbricoides TaxID=1046115 RepID=A0ABQ1MX81_9BACT|nr:hypothetical protein GCM10011506_36900 [Marivirga lumbricoides]
MLDRLFLNKLTKTGRRNYWFIQIGLDIVFIASLFLFFEYDMDYFANEGYLPVLAGVIASCVVSGVICLSFWKKTDGEDVSKL